MSRSKKGVRQGCAFSPVLFNLYAEKIFRELENFKGIVVGGHNLNNVRFSDDSTLIANTQKRSAGSLG